VLPKFGGRTACCLSIRRRFACPPCRAIEVVSARTSQVLRGTVYNKLHGTTVLLLSGARETMSYARRVGRENQCPQGRKKRLSHPPQFSRDDSCNAVMRAESCPVMPSETTEELSSQRRHRSCLARSVLYNLSDDVSRVPSGTT